LPPGARLAAIFVWLAAPAQAHEPARAEYAVRWDPSEGVPGSAREVLALLGSPEVTGEVYEVRYFDLPPPASAPPDSTVILRSRRRADGKAEIRLKYRRSSPIAQEWACPDGSPFEPSEEVDASFGRAGPNGRVYSYSCTLAGGDPPASLAAVPKKCSSRMIRYLAGGLKVEEWTLGPQRRQLEVSRSAPNTGEELSKFERLVSRLLERGIQPPDLSKTDAASDCAAGSETALTPPSILLPPELARVLTDYEEAWRNKDAAALSRLFAEDGFVLSGGAPPVRGRAAIEKAYTGSGGPLVLRAFAFATSGDAGYILGAFARREGEPDLGKFTLTLRRASGGRWEIMSDMDNPNREGRRPLLESVDHLVYAAPDLDAAVAKLEAALGVRASPGGQHPGRGTRNALLLLGPTAYLEIIAPDPGQPKPDGPLWLDLDRLEGPRLATWAARTADPARVAAEAARLGVTLGPVHPDTRRRTDGVLLSWTYTDPRTLIADGIVPFFIDWGQTPHPSRSAAAGVTLVGLRAEHPEPERVRGVLRLLEIDLPVDRGAAPALIATLETPRGRVELR
jgi:ketosteroid isomerase-like protein